MLLVAGRADASCFSSAKIAQLFKLFGPEISEFITLCDDSELEIGALAPHLRELEEEVVYVQFLLLQLGSEVMLSVTVPFALTFKGLNPVVGWIRDIRVLVFVVAQLLGHFVVLNCIPLECLFEDADVPRFFDHLLMLYFCLFHR